MTIRKAYILPILAALTMPSVSMLTIPVRNTSGLTQPLQGGPGQPLCNPDLTPCPVGGE